MSVGTFNRAIFVAPTGIIVYALHSVVLTESSIALSQLAASIFCLVVSMPPSGCPFYVLPALPPVVRGLPARPSARAEKLSPASTTRIQLQWLHSRRKLYNICTNNLPAIVTTTPFSLVKSNRPRRPGWCHWRNMTSCSAPDCNFHSRPRRCIVLRKLLGYWPGYLSCSISSRVVGVRTGLSFNRGTSMLSHTASRGSLRVLQCRTLFFALWPFSIRRPERTEIPAFMAEICWVIPFLRWVI